MKLRIAIPLLLCMCCMQIFAQEQFKIMFYNVLNYPNQGPASRIQDLEIILEAYSPDIFMACEINNANGATTILSTLQNLNADFEAANFVLNTSDNTTGDQNDLQNMLYYDGTKFILESQHVVTTIFRDFNHYVLKLNTDDQDSNPIRIHAFVAHLKASQFSPNPELRKDMVDDLVAYMNTLPADSYVILGGDLNVYTHTEPAYQELLDTTNHITLVDPADRNGSWHNNTNYIDVFTQSTRNNSTLGGAGGGFDDRFDFILTSNNILSNSEMGYVANSYQAFGNNANINCFNASINSSDCAGSLYDASIRASLYRMSDHLPVTLELETNASLSTDSFTLTDALTIQGSNLVSSLLQLEIQQGTFKDTSLYIYNTFGQLIQTFSVENTNTLTIDVSQLSDGMYYIVTQSQKPLKFIKY